MKWPSTIITSVITSLITAFIVVWFSEAMVHIVPSPQRLLLRAQNAMLPAPPRSEESFRIVLCWLENDWSGKDTKNVEDAFSGIEGINLIVSDEKIAASGAADEWRPAMQTSARAVLTKWNADLAVVGVVKQTGKVLNLWFVPRTGGGSLQRGDQPYVLENTTLGKDFHEDLQAHLAVIALTAVAPLADTTVRQRVLRKDLRIATDKLVKLTQKSTGRRIEHQALLEVGLATALVALGRTETGTESFERAIEEYREALKVFTRERYPEHWGNTMNDYGVALVALAERKTGTEQLMEAASAYQAVLKVRTRKQSPLDWASTQNNLGVALAKIGERDNNADQLGEAIAAYRVSLEERSHEQYPLDWAMTQNNLGNALVRLYKLQGTSKHLDEGIVTYRAALQERTRYRFPLQWGHTQGNLGAALIERGKRDSSSKDLKDAVDVFHTVLKELTRDRLPLDWAKAQIGLGAALRALAHQENNSKLLQEAVDAYQAALQVLDPKRTPLSWVRAQNNLGNALRDLAINKKSTKHLKMAYEAYQSALSVLTADNGSIEIRKNIEKHLGQTEQLLNIHHSQQRSNETEHGLSPPD